MDLNLVVLQGRLAAVPEHRTFESGSHLLRMLVTTRTEHPRRRLDVVPVTLWDPPPELCRLRAETPLWVVGAVQRRYWEGVEGRRSRLEVVAEHVMLEDDTGDDPVGSLGP